MKTDEIKYDLKIAEAKDTLGRIIGFVSNCDTKTSVMLGFFGVILTVIFTSSGASELVKMIKSATGAHCLTNGIFLFVLGLSIIIFCFGLFKLISVLMARIEPSEKDSLIYFRDIIENENAEVYGVKFIKATDTDVLNDLISQIYINSRICTEKYRLYNLGLRCSSVGFAFFLLIFGIGFLCY